LHHSPPVSDRQRLTALIACLGSADHYFGTAGHESHRLEKVEFCMTGQVNFLQAAEYQALNGESGSPGFVGELRQILAYLPAREYVPR
jgi:hypothetical protein